MRVRVRDVVHDAGEAAAGLFAGVRGVRHHVECRRLRHGGGVQRAGSGADAALGEDGGHDGEVVLVAHEMHVGGVARLVERIEEVGIVRAKRELVDMVAEVERLVVQMRLHAKLHVPVPSGRDVEITLDLVPLQGAVDAAAVDGRALGQLGRLLELAAFVLAHVAQHVADVRVLLLGALALLVPLVQARVHAGLHLAQAEQFARVEPEFEICVFSREQVARHDAVHGRVLHVDVQIAARHRDHNVQVQLEFVAHAALDAEVVRLAAGPPAAQLREGQAQAQDDDREGPLSAASGGGLVVRFCFGCGGERIGLLAKRCPWVINLRGFGSEGWEVVVEVKLTKCIECPQPRQATVAKSGLIEAMALKRCVHFAASVYVLMDVMRALTALCSKLVTCKRLLRRVQAQRSRSQAAFTIQLTGVVGFGGRIQI